MTHPYFDEFLQHAFCLVSSYAVCTQKTPVQSPTPSGSARVPSRITPATKCQTLPVVSPGRTSDGRFTCENLIKVILQRPIRRNNTGSVVMVFTLEHIVRQVPLGHLIIFVCVAVTCALAGDLNGQTNKNSAGPTNTPLETLPTSNLQRIKKKSHANPFADQFAKAYESIETPASKPTIRQTSSLNTTPAETKSPTYSPTPSVTAQAIPRQNEPAQLPFNQTTSIPAKVEPSLDFFSRKVEQHSVHQISPGATQGSPERVAQLPHQTPTPTQVQIIGPSAFTPASEGSIAWWKESIQVPLREGSSPQMVETNALVYNALKRSPKIRALSQNPLIREMQVSEAEAVFDPTTFLKSQFQDRVDPVGDNLSITNDGTSFLDDHIWSADAGVRKKYETGASYELSQRLGFRNSNSAFFNPQDQGTATLALNVTQPLLKGRGQYYNRSQILIAQKSTDVAWQTFQGELQNEIQKTVEAYWRLYYDRSVYLQKQRNVDRARGILAKLQGRATLDSLPSQIARARSAVLSRKTDLANARRDIRNSETELRRLTADTDWQGSQQIEMLPAELPQLDGPNYDLETVITTALEHRTEIKETLQRVRIAAVQRDISTNELLPELSLMFGTYVSTLQGDSQIGDAFIDQFAGGGVKPGYSVGVEFEVPFGNRAARSRQTQRQLQLTKIQSEVDETMQNIIAESQMSLRRVQSARETLLAATEAIVAARMDLNQNIGRWESFALVEGDLAEGQTPTTVLDQLLDSQERLTAAELVFAQAELELKTSETGLLRTMGTLLIQRNVTYGQQIEDGQPSISIN